MLILYFVFRINGRRKTMVFASQKITEKNNNNNKTYTHNQNIEAKFVLCSIA